MSKVPKIRLDELLVARGLCASRSLAKSLILSGKVRHGTEVLDKAGRTVPGDLEIAVLEGPRFVGRGGEKIEGFLTAFPQEITGKVFLDVGASTGGFTDCLLQCGAARVTCVDVGHGQLHSKLRNDPRVTNLEKVNARDLRPGDLPEAAYDGIVMDLSFISLTKVLPAVWAFLAPGGFLAALVKPQFEAEKEEVDKGRGVIRDQAIRDRVVAQVRDFALANLPGASVIGIVPSPIAGADGNQEYLLGLRRAPAN